MPKAQKPKSTPAFLVEVVTTTVGKNLKVTPVTVGDFTDIHKHLGIEGGTFTLVRLNTYGDVMYVDDEGALKENTIMYLNGNYPIYGKGLVLGSKADGSDKAPHMDMKEVSDLCFHLNAPRSN
jgi:hypothetical protein